MQFKSHSLVVTRLKYAVRSLILKKMQKNGKPIYVNFVGIQMSSSNTKPCKAQKARFHHHHVYSSIITQFSQFPRPNNRNIMY